ncbi:alpha-L-fucosidase [Pedobacter endophyticus]|uniref:alpha-L-fucosidase n=1 Tax=Pedobacter endophyticus TaxID=2789740 RepID=A0A7S9KY62_9SPHI|nr:alpha-L-fucosidase [Pedobacter endophyticus]QPH38984.1 alpha-L-fucosidase [Pedobacter endophyticus]
MKKFCILFLLLFAIGANAQQRNLVKINKNDDEKTIIAKAANVVPSARQLRWQELELTAFFHFGINTFTNREWGDGKEDISQFNPAQLDAEQWVKTVKNAGFKQVIITAKHHDGFCLWPSKFTRHTIANTPYKDGKGDIVKEVADACKKYDVGFGVYLSPWDRNSPDYGSDAYNTYFVNQLTELLTQYGQVDEVWFDGANGEGPNGKKQVYDFNSWYSLIRKLQPQAVIAVQGPDVRWVGTETGVGRETEWSVLPIAEQSQEKIAESSQKDINVIPGVLGSYKDQDRGSRPKIRNAAGLVWYPAETDVSIRPGWFYHPAENPKVKTADQLMNIYFTSVGRNGVLLLNIPPNTAGLIAESDVKNLNAFSEKMQATFSNNLAKKAIVKATSGKNTETLFDGKLNTYFTTSKKDTTATLEFKFDKSIKFNVLALQENISVGQRIEKFSAEYFDGHHWIAFASGTTVGYKRLLKLEEINTNRVRFNILSSRLNPTLAEFGLYFLAPTK